MAPRCKQWLSSRSWLLHDARRFAVAKLRRGLPQALSPVLPPAIARGPSERILSLRNREKEKNQLRGQVGLLRKLLSNVDGRVLCDSIRKALELLLKKMARSVLSLRAEMETYDLISFLSSTLDSLCKKCVVKRSLIVLNGLREACLRLQSSSVVDDGSASRDIVNGLLSMYKILSRVVDSSSKIREAQVYGAGLIRKSISRYAATFMNVFRQPRRKSNTRNRGRSCQKPAISGPVRQGRTQNKHDLIVTDDGSETNKDSCMSSLQPVANSKKRETSVDLTSASGSETGCACVEKINEIQRAYENRIHAIRKEMLDAVDRHDRIQEEREPLLECTREAALVKKELERATALLKESEDRCNHLQKRLDSAEAAHQRYSLVDTAFYDSEATPWLLQNRANSVKRAIQGCAAITVNNIQKHHLAIVYPPCLISRSAQPFTVGPKLLRNLKLAIQALLSHCIFTGFESPSFNVCESRFEKLKIAKYRRLEEFKMFVDTDPETLGQSNCEFKEFLLQKGEAFIGTLRNFANEMVADDIQCQLRDGNNQWTSSFAVLVMSVWLLHKVAFAFEPSSAEMFLVTPDSFFDEEYMKEHEDIKREAYAKDLHPVKRIVACMTVPGFTLRSSIIPADVCCVDSLV